MDKDIQAGEVLAVPHKCAVRDAVELLVLAAGDPVANVASKGRAKDAKYRHEGNRNNGERKSGMGIVDHRDNEKGYGNPHSCTGNTASDNTSNHLNDLHNLMRTHCQFTVKRPEKRVDLTVAPEQQPCGVQVVEWVGLVAFFRAVFAEEIGNPFF